MFCQIQHQYDFEAKKCLKSITTNVLHMHKTDNTENTSKLDPLDHGKMMLLLLMIAQAPMDPLDLVYAIATHKNIRQMV